jgi:hypothetical protein
MPATVLGGQSEVCQDNLSVSDWPTNFVTSEMWMYAGSSNYWSEGGIIAGDGSGGKRFFWADRSVKYGFHFHPWASPTPQTAQNYEVQIWEDPTYTPYWSIYVNGMQINGSYHDYGTNGSGLVTGGELGNYDGSATMTAVGGSSYLYWEDFAANWWPTWGPVAGEFDDNWAGGKWFSSGNHWQEWTKSGDNC